MTTKTRSAFQTDVTDTLEDGGGNTALELRTRMTDLSDSAHMPLTDDSDDITEGATNLFLTSAERAKLSGIATGAEVNVVDSVNGNVGTIVLDPDDLDDAATTNKFTSAADITKLSGIATAATANPNAIDNIVEDTTPQLGGNLDGNDNEISNYISPVKEITTTTYTLLEADKGKILRFTNAGAITVTLPNDLNIGWAVTCVQKGAGAITFSADTGATIANRSSETATAGIDAMVTLLVDENSDDTSAGYTLGGDTA